MSAQTAAARKTLRFRGYLLLVLVALLAQAMPPLGLNFLAHAAYGETSWTTPTTVLPISQLWLVLTAISGTAVAVAAMYTSLLKAKLVFALPLVLLCMVALGASIFYLFAFLAFQGLL